MKKRRCDKACFGMRSTPLNSIPQVSSRQTKVNTSGIVQLDMQDKTIILTSELIRAARALLRWEQRQLAEASNVSLPTIKRLESKPGPLIGYSSTIGALRNALESAGIEFVNGGRPGVRVRRTRKRS